MEPGSPTEVQATRREPGRSPAATIIRAAMAFALIGSLFAAAGTLYWWAGWLWLLLIAATLTATRMILLVRNPELVSQRRRVGPGTPRWDLILVPLYWATMLVEIALGALESRPDPELIRWPSSIAGALVYLVAAALSTWAMAVNPYFEGTARIQRDRNQVVVGAGPYRWVRHPGYLALVLIAGSVALMLGVRWVFVPAALVLIELVVRTALEDRMLQRELEGYREYAARVRWRLLPGVW